MLQLAKQFDKQDEWSTTVMQTLKAEEPGDLVTLLSSTEPTAWPSLCELYLSHDWWETAPRAASRDMYTLQGEGQCPTSNNILP